TIDRLHDFWKRLREECLDEGGCPVFQSKAKDFLADFESAMDDNLNTSVALAALHNLVREVNIALSQKTLLCEDRHVILRAIEKFDTVFGIFGKQNDEMICAEVERLIEERNAARRNRDFARSDEIRDLLCEQGIILEDAPGGVKWKRKKQ
ncbi:MAG: DALR domain-containing protein, partial [Pyrinomonadaceae bacterium]